MEQQPITPEEQHGRTQTKKVEEAWKREWRIKRAKEKVIDIKGSELKYKFDIANSHPAAVSNGWRTPRIYYG